MEYTEKEIELIRKYYPNSGAKYLFELMGGRHTLKAIKAKAKRIGVKFLGWKHWSDEDENLFKIAWPTYSMEDLLKAFPGRTYQSLMNHASQIGLKSNGCRLTNSDASFLTYENLSKESAYWWGFIMADGHISKNSQLIITLKDVDEKHLMKLANRLNRELNYKTPGFVTLTIDNSCFNKWLKILEMKETAKTYFPPNLKVFEKYFPYFFIGFIDGDGNIHQDKRSNNNFSIQMEIHSSWINNLNYFKDLLEKQLNITASTSISKRGYARLYITATKNVYKLKDIAKEVDYLERKWDKIHPKDNN